MVENSATEEYNDLTFSELEEMAQEEEDKYVIDFTNRYIWESASNNVPSLSTSSDF